MNSWLKFFSESDKLSRREKQVLHYLFKDFPSVQDFTSEVINKLRILLLKLSEIRSKIHKKYLEYNTISEALSIIMGKQIWDNESLLGYIKDNMLDMTWETHIISQDLYDTCSEILHIIQNHKDNQKIRKILNIQVQTEQMIIEILKEIIELAAEIENTMYAKGVIDSYMPQSEAADEIPEHDEIADPTLLSEAIILTSKQYNRIYSLLNVLRVHLSWPI